jgi:hypothetical protein
LSVDGRADALHPLLSTFEVLPPAFGDVLADAAPNFKQSVV